ncbi:hypothetical protein J9332_42575, partial [Aquimarina celericrescens]|nr:hypothetical protein [Aquimarina celericrescens]
DTSYNASEDNAYVDSEIILTASNDSPVGGEVYFKDLTVDGSDWCAIYSRKRADAFYATFEDCTFKNVSQAGTKSPIYLEVGSYFD